MGGQTKNQAVGGPIRTCVGCRKSRPALELVRIHATESGELALNRNGAGRGAWICRDNALGCLDKAAKIKGFERALRQPVHPASLLRLRAHVEHERRTFSTLEARASDEA